MGGDAEPRTRSPQQGQLGHCELPQEQHHVRQPHLGPRWHVAQVDLVAKDEPVQLRLVCKARCPRPRREEPHELQLLAADLAERLLVAKQVEKDSARDEHTVREALLLRRPPIQLELAEQDANAGLGAGYAAPLALGVAHWEPVSHPLRPVALPLQVGKRPPLEVVEQRRKCSAVQVQRRPLVAATRQPPLQCVRVHLDRRPTDAAIELQVDPQRVLDVAERVAL